MGGRGRGVVGGGRRRRGRWLLWGGISAGGLDCETAWLGQACILFLWETVQNGAVLRRVGLDFHGLGGQRDGAGKGGLFTFFCRIYYPCFYFVCVCFYFVCVCMSAKQR